MLKRNKIKLMSFFLSLIMCMHVFLPTVYSVPEKETETNDKTEEIYPNLDLSLYTVDKLPKTLKDNVLSDKSDEISISPLNADDLYSVTLDNGDGTQTINVFQQPIKYIDENGAVKFRTNTIEKASKTGFLSLKNPEYAYKNEEGDIKTYFSDNISKGVRLVHNDIEISMAPLIDSEKYPDVSSLIGSEITGAGTNIYKSVSISEAKELKTESDVIFSHKGDKIEYSNVLADGIIYEYAPIYNGIKESIILNEYSGINTFRFVINMGDLVPETMAVRGNGIRLHDPLNPDSAEFINISPIYTVDAVGQESYNHAMYFTETDASGEYILTVVVDRDFLESPNTVYPVTIDPTIYADSTTNIADTFVSSNHANTNYSTQTFMPVGKDINYADCELFIQFKGIERYRYIPPNNITKVTFSMNCYYTTGTSSNPVRLYAYDNISECNISQINWQSKPDVDGDGYGTADGAPVSVHSATIYNFHITDLAKQWFKHEVNEGGYTYLYSLSIRQYNSSGTTHYATFRTTEYSASYPYFSITYTPSIPLAEESTMIQLKNRANSKNIDAAQANNYSVLQYTADNRLNQWWKAIHLGNGVYKFENQWPHYQTQGRKFLSVSEVTNAVDLYYESSSLLTQRFYIIPCYSSSGISQGYRIVSLYNVDQPGANGNKAISNGGSGVNGASITYSTYNGSNNYQKWIIKEAYKLNVTPYYDYAFDVRYDNAADSISAALETVRLVFLENFGLNITYSLPIKIYSTPDSCKLDNGKGISESTLDWMCPENPMSEDYQCTFFNYYSDNNPDRRNCTDWDQLHTDFMEIYYGSFYNIPILFTGNILYNDQGIACNRSYYTSNGADICGISMQNICEANSYAEKSVITLVHEISHVVGAPDHYHEIITPPNGTPYCANQEICSECTPEANRPSTCIMSNHNNTYISGFSPNEIYCEGCRNDIMTYLNENFN